MVVLNEEDLQTMIKIEELLHNKLVITNSIVDKRGGYYFNEYDDEYNMWCKYNTLVEKLCQYKDWCKKWNKDSE
mgnify:CR=1 FL=1